MNERHDERADIAAGPDARLYIANGHCHSPTAFDRSCIKENIKCGKLAFSNEQYIGESPLAPPPEMTLVA